MKRINSSGKYSVRELWSVGVDANQLQADVFHSPHYTVPFGLKMPCVTTIHDVLHVRGKKYFPFVKRMYARSMIHHACRSSKAIIVDSEFTKRELLDISQVDEKLIHIVHLGISPIYFQNYSKEEIQEFRKKHGLVKPTILYTGSLKPHKNIRTLLEAFARIKNRTEFQLAFAGESFAKYEYIDTCIREQGIAGDVVELGQISRRNLAIAYRASAVVVLPSLYEGFGFSVLEAMASGTPAIGARAASIPEVMGDAGILFDPYDIENLTSELQNILQDSTMRSEIVRKGFKNVSRFSWERCAEQTFQIYMKVL